MEKYASLVRELATVVSVHPHCVVEHLGQSGDVDKHRLLVGRAVVSRLRKSVQWMRLWMNLISRNPRKLNWLVRA